MLIIYSIILGLLSVYSYALVDPNFTLFNHLWWEGFRNFMVQLGYYQRPLSFAIYLAILIGLSFYNWYFVHIYKKINPVKLALIIAVILLCSYPFLSHDFFNYLFDAKILSFYGKNPYLYKALDFPNDPWIRFMHWTHRTYPYGPGFLLLSLIPSFFSFGKLILAFIFFKLLFASFYILSVWVLNKFGQKAALFFATSPLVIIEGLVNNHNDLIGVGLALMALYFLYKAKRPIVAAVLGLFSVGIKYITIAFLPLVGKSRAMVYLAAGLFGLLLCYMYTKVGIQPWYLLNLSVLLVYLKKPGWPIIGLTFGLLLSYYPYILFGGWDENWKVLIKEQIILISLVLFLLSFFFRQKSTNLLNKTSLCEKKNT